MPMHERGKDVSKETMDLERARMSLREELEAIDWYSERIDATDNEALKRILDHNRAEEKEHAAMLYKWLCENDEEQGEEAAELEGKSIVEAIESEEH